MSGRHQPHSSKSHESALDVNDLYQWSFRPLPFAAEDVKLIYEAWERRKQAD